MSSVDPALYDGLTKDAFDAVGWPALVAAVRIKLCSEYIKPLNEKAEALEIARFPVSACAARALADVMGYGLQPHDREFPFHSMVVADGTRSPLPEDLPQSVIQILLQLANDAADPEFKARLGDVCSLRLPKKVGRLTEATAAAYLESAKNLFQVGKWDSGIPRVSRALQLATKPSLELRESIKLAFTGFFREFAPQAPLLEVVQMMELYRGHAADVPGELCEHALHYSKKFIDEKKWHLRRRLLTLAAEGLQSLGRESDARDALCEAAETHVKLAEESLRRPTPDPLVAANELSRAIIAYGEIGNAATRVAELERLRAEYQKQGIRQNRWRSIAEEPGNEFLKAVLGKAERCLDSAALAAAKATQGLPVPEALRLLALCHPPPNKTRIEEVMLNELKTSVWNVLLKITLYDEEGRPFAKAGSYLNENEKGQRKIIEQRMLRFFTTLHVQETVAIVEAVREQIIAEHTIEPGTLESIITHSPFVPRGRDYFFLRGILAGFAGDFLIAGHLLVPQVEEAIRFHLHASGAIPTVTESSETERTADLNYLFNHKRSQIESVFGVDETFELEALLIRRWGCHLRNNIAHGKLLPHDFFQPPLVYLWWITMRLCMFGPGPLPTPGICTNELQVE